MTYIATVVNIMIACPSDVVQEKELVRNAIREWNIAHSMTRKLVLFGIDWKQNCYPAMGDRSQQLIHDQITNDSDMLIAIFKNRVGTDAGKGMTGTEEEIEEHIRAKKPVMLYFANASSLQSTTDDATQHSKLQVLKKKYAPYALHVDFESHSELQTLITRHLAQHINHDFQTESYLLSKGRKKKSSKPKTFNSPQLRIRLNNTLGEITMHSHIGARYHHVLVENLSDAVVAKNVRVEVSKIERLTPSNQWVPEKLGKPHRLYWQKLGDNCPDIWREPALCDIGYIQHLHLCGFVLQLRNGAPNIRGNVAANESMRVTFVAKADNATPCSMTLQISWDGKWADDPMQMATHLQLVNV